MGFHLLSVSNVLSVCHTAEVLVGFHILDYHICTIKENTLVLF
jgi:hypothetical protein